MKRGTPIMTRSSPIGIKASPSGDDVVIGHTQFEPLSLEEFLEQELDRRIIDETSFYY